MKIQSTQDYNLFKRIPGNRVVSHAHVNRLLEAIKEDPETVTYSPILVNDKYEVIDGQHRLDAMEKLELPVFYLKVDNLNLETVQRLNTVAKTWSPVDFAKSFAELGNENYQIYLDFKGEFHYGHNTLLRYLSLDLPVTNTSFKEGKFKVKDEAKSWQYCTQLRELAEFYPRFLNRNAAMGIFKILNSPNYDHKRMMSKMRTHADKINEQALENDWARELEKLYNYRNHNDPTILFSLVRV